VSNLDIVAPAQTQESASGSVSLRFVISVKARDNTGTSVKEMSPVGRVDEAQVPGTVAFKESCRRWHRL